MQRLIYYAVIITTMLNANETNGKYFREYYYCNFKSIRFIPQESLIYVNVDDVHKCIEERVRNFKKCNLRCK